MGSKRRSHPGLIGIAIWLATPTLSVLSKAEGRGFAVVGVERSILSAR